MKDKFKLYRKQIPLQIFVWIGIIYLFIFNVVPMFGIIMGFKDYQISMGVQGIFTSPWVGFKWFIEFFNEYKFANLLKNTVGISLLKLVFSFPVPIIFAIIISEIKSPRWKKILQTGSYLPHFMSWIIIAGISLQFLGEAGVINTLFQKIGLISEPIKFMTQANKFWGVAVFLDVWKETGWWAIVFLAAIAGINMDQYEAAEIDGASRLQRIWYITLPSLKGTMVIVLIMTMGNLFGGGLSGSNFEQSYLLGNNINKEASEIIQTYVFDVGLAQGRYAYATAVGLVQSVVSLILIFGSNFAAKKTTGSGLF